MICPKCGAEYREGYTICDDCKVLLVEKEDTKVEESIIAMNRVKVANVRNHIESSQLLDILANNGIQGYAQDVEYGSYLNIAYGFSVYGVDIFVDMDDADNAIDIIKENYVSVDLDEDKEDKQLHSSIYEMNNKDNNFDENEFEKYPFWKTPRGVAIIIIVFNLVMIILIIILTIIRIGM